MVQRQRVDAGEFGGDLFGGCGVGSGEEGKGLSGFDVRQHEADADGDFADCVAIHPRDTTFKLFQFCERLLYVCRHELRLAWVV